MEMSDESFFVCDVIALSPPPSFSLSSSYYILYYTTFFSRGYLIMLKKQCAVTQLQLN